MTKIIDTLHSHFGRENVIEIEKHKDVFLCEKKTDDNETYQVIFIDTSDNWCEENFTQ